MKLSLGLPAILAMAALLSTALGPGASTARAQGFLGAYTRDGIDVVAVGENGETYRSLDAGSSWSELVIGSPTRALRDITGRGLTMLMVGDGGLIWSSVDGGGHWTSTVAPSAPKLCAAAMVSDAVWVVAGSGGTLLRTTNSGANWSAVTSGTTQALNALRFTDSQHGWVAGDGGTLLKTTNGGASWSPVSIGTQNALLSVDQRGATVWVVGANGAAWRSVNGGVSFNAVNLKLDARADVRCVTMQSPDTLWLAGGGGFIRYTTDGGSTWTFQQHQLLAPITRLIALGSGVWVTNASNRVVMSSANRGVTWSFPTGASVAHSWGSAPKYPLATGATRGSTFALNPVYKNAIYCALGYNVLRSRDDGETWQVAATFPNGNDACNAFLVSPRDSNLWLAAISGATHTDRVYRTTNGGTSWTQVLAHNFGEYGVPLEMDPDRPDTVLFGGELSANGMPQDELSRSVDFGATWTSIPTALFRSPCDMVIVPDTTGIVLVGDGVTGSGKGKFLKSTDGGLTFTVKLTTGSTEIPGLATSRLRPNVIFGTIWSGGGVQRSTDYGDTWPTSDTQLQPWGIDIAQDDPNVVVYAQYSSPNLTRLSLDGGDTFTTIAPPAGFGANYSFYARDRATILVEQGSGIWKLQSTYSYMPSVVTKTLQLSSPNGGEGWEAGSMHDITWASAGIAIARIEYRRAPGEPWQHVADVGGYLNRYAWSVPWDPTTHAAVRVYDLWTGTPLDSSDTGFTILAPLAVEPSPALAFALGQNRPNPFSAATSIRYTLPREADVRLDVFDLHGHRVARLASGRQAAGPHEVRFGLGGQRSGRSSDRLPVGMYFCRLQAGSLTATRKMLLVE